jgi:hypothetical protein
MNASNPISPETRSKSNEKLLKALIVLLALKDEGLLDELRTIFTVAAMNGSEIGKADPQVWTEISRRLQVIEALVVDEEVAEGEGERERQGGLQ